MVATDSFIINTLTNGLNIIEFNNTYLEVQMTSELELMSFAIEPYNKINGAETNYLVTI
jgi:hypothetical protein